VYTGQIPPGQGPAKVYQRIMLSSPSRRFGSAMAEVRAGDSSSKLRPPDTGSVEGIAGENGGQTDNGEEKPHAET
jgi:hypothetical protein